jgi:hypothetical protein
MTKPSKRPEAQADRDDAIRKSALAMARDLLDEALAVLEGPLDDAAKLREKLKTAASTAVSATHKDVIAFAKADRNHAQLESVVAQIRAACDRASEGGR